MGSGVGRGEKGGLGDAQGSRERGWGRLGRGQEGGSERERGKEGVGERERKWGVGKR